MTTVGTSKTPEVRRARRGDLASISDLVHRAARSRVEASRAQVQDWLLRRSLWVAEENGVLLGVAAWHAENLVSITDLFYVSPARSRTTAGGRLLETIEAQANVLMCEVNVVVLPAWTSKAVRGFFRKQGYEAKVLEELPRVWREALREFVRGDQDLMLKHLRERMVMAPV
jgi:N-acetylglutamate synthase-like GNAT family acetyltransferase